MRLFAHPLLCNYYVTYRCNARCSFCDIPEKPSSFVEKNSVYSNLKALKLLKVKVIDFTGGEPLLHRQLPDFLQVAKSLGFITTVTTNTLLYPRQAKALAGLVDMLHFSIDSIDPQTHNRSRGVACFDTLLESLDVAKALGEKPDLLFTVTPSNFHELENIYTFSQNYKVLLIINPIFEYNSVGQSLPVSSLNKIRNFGKKPGVYLNEAFIALRLAGGNQTQTPVCKAASSTIVISPQNELILPCYHAGVVTFPIKDNLVELWRSEAVQEAIALEGRMPACQGCVINCYMQPSFAYQLNRYFWKALPSTFKYTLEKWVYA